MLNNNQFLYCVGRVVASVFSKHEDEQLISEPL